MTENYGELLPKTARVRTACLERRRSRAHAIAEVVKRAPNMKKSQILVVNLSGRGDKDVQQVARIKGVTL